jgi:surface antigen/peptidoglycan hydrolase CwlO-like protein
LDRRRFRRSHRISAALLAICLATLALPASVEAAAVPFAPQDPAQELVRLNRQLDQDQARLDSLNNSVEVAEAAVDGLNRQLAADQQRDAELGQQITDLARMEYERPALTLSTILEAPTLNQLISEIAQARLVSEKQRRLKAQLEDLRRRDQKDRDEQSANAARIKAARDEAAQVTARTMALRSGANDAVIQARAEAVAAQARATQASRPPPPKPAAPPPPRPAPPPVSAPPPTGAIVEAPGPNHFAYGYCTWYVANRRNVPWFGNAKEWWGNAPPYGYAEGQAPVVGAIMVTRESGWGHVAYVESVNGDGSWTVSEMNFSGWNVVTRRTLRPGQAPVVGFIYGRR